jgi:hypothetical protein
MLVLASAGCSSAKHDALRNADTLSPSATSKVRPTIGKAGDLGNKLGITVTAISART